MHLKRVIDNLNDDTKVLKSQMQSMTPRQQNLRKEIEIKEAQLP